MEPGDGDDVRAVLESLERRRCSSKRQQLAGGAGVLRTAAACGWRRSSSNGNGLRAALELLGRQRPAGSPGVLRTEVEFAACGEAFGMRSVFFSLR